MNFRILWGALCLGAWGMLCATPAAASCGSAMCSVNTDWAAHGAAVEPGLRVDLRLEYVPQNQLREGAEVVDHPSEHVHHEEVHTWNRNLIVTLDYAINDRWGVALAVPYVDRDHKHIHHHHDEELIETWRITGLGDARLVARYQMPLGAESRTALGIQAGLKLPTGATDAKNSEGEEAERPLQAGTGTTDTILGVYVRQRLDGGWGWFFQAQRQAALAEHEDFRPGNRTMADAGVRYEASNALALMLQVNAQWRERDLGAMADSENSGGYAYFLSPGAAYAVTRDLLVYGFYQHSLYQYVNGVQLTANSAAVLGASVRF